MAADRRSRQTRLRWLVRGSPLALLFFCTMVAAQDADVQDHIKRLEQTIARQQADLDAQRQQLADLADLIKQLQAGQAPTTPSTTAAPVAGVAAASPDNGPAAESMSDGQQAAMAEQAKREAAGGEEKVDSQATLYDPSSTTFDPAFVGAWHLPGTTAAMKLGGFVNLDLINNLDPLVSTNSFVVGTIPPAGTEVAGAQAGTTVTANQTRVNLEVREQTSRGEMRAFVEGDFDGDGNSFRLRHAYGQYGWALAGQTWSAFANLESQPEEVDFEGINGAIIARQPQLRIFPRLGHAASLIFSIENPETDIVNGLGLPGRGDFVLTVDRVPLGRLGSWNYKFGAIVRQLKGQFTTDDSSDVDQSIPTESTTGWGITTSGRTPVTFWSKDDFLLWQLTYGDGVGRYINDLKTVGGGDAVFDPQGNLQSLPVFAGFLSYQHEWANRFKFFSNLQGLLRSNFTFSWVDVDNYDFQEDSAYNTTLRASINLLYFPADNMRLGAEFLWGKRINKDQSSGTASQVQVSARYSF